MTGASQGQDHTEATFPATTTTTTATSHHGPGETMALR